MSDTLIDNTSHYVSAPGWVTIQSGGTLGGTVSRANNTNDYTSFSIEFTGTLLNLFVLVSPFKPPKLPAYVTLILDDGAQTWTAPTDVGNNGADSNDQIATHWFTTPTMNSGPHTLTITNFPPHFSFDYATVFPETTSTVSSSLLDVDVVIEDDDGPSLSYTGNWNSNTSSFLVPLPSSGNQLSILPFDDGTHFVSSLSTTQKTTATFHFKGTSVFVYGFFAGSRTGVEKMTIGYTLDGHEVQQEYFPGTQMQANYLWYSNTTIDLTSAHTLEIEVIELNGINFNFDYILYTPSPHEEGQFYPLAQSNSIPTQPWPLPDSTNAATWGYTHNSKHTPKGAIIGGAVGGAVVLIIALLVIWRFCARRHKHH